jgi:hypothetical protein
MHIPEESSESNARRASYRHTIPLIIIIALLLIAAVVVQQLLIPPSFGEKGYYRADAVEEAQQFPVKHIGEEACNECHDDIVALHQKDAHAAVPCESCHGPGNEHAKAEGDVALTIPKGKEPCLVCHRLLAARPSAFPQITWQDHFKFVGVKDLSIACMECHSPHEPLFMDRDLRTARLHPLIQRCRDCHIGRLESNLEKPKDHPAIFECSYCHKQIVDDFADREHAEIQCTTCHIFIKESDFAGRIIRDSDPRFCLLCHRKADFRSSDAPPGIEWPGHLDDVSTGPEDRKKRCIDCHRDRIHMMTEGGQGNE